MVMKKDTRSSGIKNSHSASLPVKIPHELACGGERVETGIVATELPPRVHLGLKLAGTLCAAI
jgi:hypothetical protein